MAPSRHAQLCLRPFAPREVQHRQQEAVDRLNNVAARGETDVEVVWWSPRTWPPEAEDPLSAGCPSVAVEVLDVAASEGVR
jgi:hypothetical protein